MQVCSLKCLAVCGCSKRSGVGLGRFALASALAWTFGGGLFWRYVGLRLDVAADRALLSFVL
jgi:hypothetical protein